METCTAAGDGPMGWRNAVRSIFAVVWIVRSVGHCDFSIASACKEIFEVMCTGGDTQSRER